MSRKNLARLLIVLLPLLWFVFVSPPRPAQSAQQKTAQQKYVAAGFDQAVAPFLAENCVMCHNAKRQSGSLNLEQFKTAASLNAHRETWEQIAQKIRTGEMPPKGVPRPNDAESKFVVGWIEGEFERSDRLVKPDPGRVTARRLNRAEYNNTIRDLLGVDLKLADDFPQDDSGYGFDNIGDVLSLSPVLMEKYLASAEKIARAAIYGPPVLKPTLVRHQGSGRPNPPRMTPVAEYDQTGLSLPNAVHATHRFPVDGEYVIRFYLGGTRPLGSEPLQLALWIDGKKVQQIGFDPEKLASFSDDRQDFGSMTQEFRVNLTQGDHWLAGSVVNLYEGLPPSYQGSNPSKRPAPTPPEFKPPRNLPPERLEAFKKRFEEKRAEKIPVNQGRINSLEISGPHAQVKGPSPEIVRKIFICRTRASDQGGCARKIVANFARRAYRRPVTASEINQLTSLVAAAQKEGDSFEEGVCLAVQAMLVSPHFLFRIEKDQPAKVPEAITPISNHELASRLSYFFWSSMPDDELFRLADQGTLKQPAALAAQVQRMLKDPKSSALVENFGGQWLELRKLESIKPNRERFPEFDPYLRMSMLRETELFFQDLVREDRSILDFIDGNYSFLNERLAKFYQIPGVDGPEFRKVSLAGNPHRGGVLTQASVLTVSSYATRTSPVLRGKWILENILNAPPPPAPPGVPNIDEAKIGTSASLRQQLELHRQNTTCAACHSRMDPLGFGLENFNAIGAWRTQDGNFPIDASGMLPDGRIFKGPQELKTIVKADNDAFAECLTEKLLTYALGRGVERYDKPAIRKIAKAVAANDYRFSSLALEIVKSLPFQNRRAVRPGANNQAMK